MLLVYEQLPVLCNCFFVKKVDNYKTKCILVVSTYLRGYIVEISAKELRGSSSKIIEQAARGTEVIITLRGKKMAKLIPYTLDAAKNSGEDEIFGIWRNHSESEDVDGHVRSIRKGRKF